VGAGGGGESAAGKEGSCDPHARDRTSGRRRGQSVVSIRSGLATSTEQGAIVAFVVLVAAYVKLMNALDHRHGVFEDD